MSSPQKSKHLGQSNNTRENRSGTKDIVVRSKVRVVVRTYAIRAREEAVESDVFTGTFYLFDVSVYSLLDLRSTHSYICTTLVTDMNLPIESIEFDVQATNPLG